MKKMIAILLAAAMATAFTACSSGSGSSSSAAESTGSAASESTESAQSSEAAGESALDKIKESGKLIMATNAAFPPFEYISNNEPAGVDVDIANEIAKDLGVELQVDDMDFNAIVPAIQAGKADIGAAGMTITEERQKEVDFSEEYVKSSQYVIIASGSGVTVESLKDAGVIIGVQEGTTGDFYATDDIKGDPNTEEVARYKNAIVAAQDLINGKCNAVIIDEMTAKNIVEENAGKLELLPEVLTEESYAIAVPKGDTALLEAVNQTIARLKSEGKIDEFVLTHTGE